MAARDVGQMAQDVAQLLEQRLKLGGSDLSGKLGRGARLLPRKVRRAAQALAEQEGLSSHPKARMLQDHALAEASYRTCMAYLRPLGRRDRLVDGALHFAGALALIFLVVGGGLVAVLALRGYI